MRNIFNFTNRDDSIRKTGNLPEIKIIVTERNEKTFFEPILKLDEARKFPADAELFIQPYSNSGYVGKPYSLGLISSFEQKQIEEPEVGPDEIKFRLKIVSNIKYGKVRKVLGQCLQIEPWGSTTFLRIGKRDQKTLFEIEILPGNVPTIFFKKGFGLEKDIKQSNFLKNIFFHYAVKEILTTYLIEKDEFNECDSKKTWAKEFELLTKSKFPEKYDDDAKEWINDACHLFATLKKAKNNSCSLLDLMPDASVEIKDKILYQK